MGGERGLTGVGLVNSVEEIDQEITGDLVQQGKEGGREEGREEEIIRWSCSSVVER